MCSVSRSHLLLMGNVQEPRTKTAPETRNWWGRPTQNTNQAAFAREVILAAESGDISKLKKFHSCIRGGLTKVRCDKTNSTPLHAAASYGHSNIVKYLLSKGADPNAQDCSLETPLHTSAKAGSTDCLLLLLKAKASTEVKDTWGRTPLLKAIVYNRPKCVHWLLDAHACTNVFDIDGLTPVHVAASYGQVILLRKLVKAHARLNIVNRKGRLPISKAINAGQVAMVIEMIKIGAQTYFEKHCIVKDAISKLAQTHPAAKESEMSNYIMVETVISAHGYTLDEDILDMFLSIYRSLNPNIFLPILMKLALVSGKPNSSCPHQLAPHHVEQLVKFLPDHFKLFSLQNLAQRKVRQCLMSSGENVVRACDKLDIAPMLKKIILLQDV